MMKEKIDDDPPHSRVFILHSRDLKEEDIENGFSKFGTVEKVWRVKDRNTGENKGVSYVKYSKMSEAAAAVEEMNGVSLDGQTRPLKVLIANRDNIYTACHVCLMYVRSRDEGSKREENEKDRLLRIFIVIPKEESATEDELKNYFSEFGKVDYVFILKDKETNKNKGFAYVKYFKIYDTAKALEECDRKYKPVLARPRERGNEDAGGYGRSSKNMKNMGPDTGYRRKGVQQSRGFSEQNGSYGGGFTRLSAYLSSQLTENQALRLFDLIPGFEFGRFTNEVSYRTRRMVVEYSSPQTAEYAIAKLNGFEYPIGEPIMVKMDQDWGQHPDVLPPSLLGKRDYMGMTVNNESDIESTQNVEEHCSAVLPPLQPVIKDQDGKYRFGNLVDLYLLPNRNCGYAMYYTEESANEARTVLNNQKLFNSTLTVIEADPPRGDGNKRSHID